MQGGLGSEKIRRLVKVLPLFFKPESLLVERVSDGINIELYTDRFLDWTYKVIFAMYMSEKTYYCMTFKTNSIPKYVS